MKLYRVTLDVVVHAPSEDAALDRLDKAAAKAAKASADGHVEMSVEEAPDE